MKRLPNQTSELPFPCSERSLRALAQTIVPEAWGLSNDGWRDLYRIISDALSTRPPAVKRQLSVFVRVLDFLSLVRYGRRLAVLTDPQRRGLLHSVERSRVLLLRKGLWGLRTLIFMGFYARPEAAEQLEYGADRRGWSKALARVES